MLSDEEGIISRAGTVIWIRAWKTAFASALTRSGRHTAACPGQAEQHWLAAEQEILTLALACKPLPQTAKLARRPSAGRRALNVRTLGKAVHV